jgi:hypothetical protein
VRLADAQHNDHVERKGLVERSPLHHDDQLLDRNRTQQQVHDAQPRPAPDANVMPPEEEPQRHGRNHDQGQRKQMQHSTDPSP